LAVRGWRVFQPEDLVASGQAERLAQARKSSGRDPGELAHLLGISYEAYRDLESFDEEIVDTISYRQLLLLAGAVHLDLRSFFEAGDQMEAYAFADLAARLNELVADGAVTLATLEDEVGWELKEVLEKPDLFGELPAVALADIGERFGIDWRSFLPPGALATGAAPGAE
jgi:transcriptional regulator with XRE-family HTH domain